MPFNFKKYAEPFRFVLVGGLATLIHYGIYLVLNLVMVVWLAYSIGYGVSFLCNFYLSSVFTFRAKPSFRKGVGFALSHAVNYGLHLLFLSLFLRMGMAEAYAPIPVFCLVIPINFLLVRFVFKSGKI